MTTLYEMTPREIVAELDKYIIGQDSAKRSVAVALRNRSRAYWLCCIYIFIYNCLKNFLFSIV
ncbi:MAG: hypothetical protein IJE87_06625 [Firmicutes bacterium]|nr:hypothetical protein [Bacillota bacterium]